MASRVDKCATSTEKNMTLAVADMAVPTTSSVNERKKSTARAGRCSMDIIQQLRTKKWRYFQGGVASTRRNPETSIFQNLIPYLQVSSVYPVSVFFCCINQAGFFASQLLAPGATTMHGFESRLSTRDGSWLRKHCLAALPPRPPFLRRD